MPIICAKTYLNTQIQADTKTLLFISWRHCLLLWNRHQVWIIWLGNLRRACTHTYTVPSLYKYVFPDVYVLFKWFGLTKRKHTVSFPCSWAVTVRSNRSCRLCWVFLIKNGLLLVAPLLKTTDLRAFLSPAFSRPLVLCAFEYGCSHSRRYTQTNVSKSSSKLKRKAARRVKSEHTLMQEASHLSHAAQTGFQVPNRTSSCQSLMLALTSSSLFLWLIFSKASCLMKNKWPLNDTSHFSTYSLIVELPRDCFLYLPLLVTKQSTDTCIANKMFYLYSHWKHMYFVFCKYHLHGL